MIRKYNSLCFADRYIYSCVTEHSHVWCQRFESLMYHTYLADFLTKLSLQIIYLSIVYFVVFDTDSEGFTSEMPKRAPTKPFQPVVVDLRKGTMCSRWYCRFFSVVNFKVQQSID